MESSLFSKFGKDPQGNKSLGLSGSQFKAYEEVDRSVPEYAKARGDCHERRQLNRKKLPMIGRNSFMKSLALSQMNFERTSAKPGVAQELKKLLNKSYAQYKTLEKASTASSTGEGLFTPAQSIRAAKQGNKSSKPSC